MTTSQELSIKISAIGGEINVLAAKEPLAEGEAAKLDELRAKFSEKGSQFRAALTVEAEDESRALGLFGDGDGDGESAERRALLRSSTVASYLTAAAAGLGLSGAPAELNAALEVPIAGAGGGPVVPWVLLENRQALRPHGNGEQRAFTTTASLAGSVIQKPILQRLFGDGDSLMASLGVRIEAVPAGRSEFPLLATGVAPANVAEGTAAADAVAATFSTQTLKPKRLTGKYEFSHEQAAQVSGIEEALRRDLAGAVRSKMSALVMNGDEGTNSHEPNGFLTKLTIPTTPTVEASFADHSSLASTVVDGIHASMESEVSIVLGVESYKHSAKIYQTSGSGESASEALKRRARSVLASSFVPASASDIQSGNLLHAGGANGGENRGDSVAAVWGGGPEIIRDPYSSASIGVSLTWITLWDFEAAFRSAAYKRISFLLA